jgi:hypothetical protein
MMSAATIASPAPTMFATPRRAVIITWAVMAAINLSAGLVLASVLVRQRDLNTMRRWGREWLVGGLNVYMTPCWTRTVPYARRSGSFRSGRSDGTRRRFAA